ncbi:MAG: acetate--CoA ligase family protein [Mesorhizobium sp.]|nr:acetate--CoA ligase family protein [Mesorhizobium sp.]MBL8575584.1 acetate--CoA ligase family protein [Mesorhizobium sp.]
MAQSQSKIANLLRPKSIAIVGASDRADAFGQRLLHAVSAGYGGHVYPVNPKYESIAGVNCYPDVASLPTLPDCVLLAVGDGLIVDAFENVAKAGVPAAVIFGRAYGEHRNGRQRTGCLAEIAQEAGVALAGANCMGFINLVDRLQVTGFPFSSLGAAGQVALVSHSGSTWSGLVGNSRQIRFNYAVSAGQELATSVADYLKFFLDEGQTRVAACVLETIRNPEGFLDALEQADKQDVPVVVLKLGRSDAGKEFALSHTGALSGSNAAYDAIFSRYNVVSVRTLDELADTVELLQSPRKPTTKEVGVGTDSGGERQLIVDIATDVGVKFASLAAATDARLAQYLDPGVEPSNPVDYWGDGGDIMAPCLSALADDPGIGMVAMASNMVDGRGGLHGNVQALEAVFEATDKPVALFGNVATTMARAEVAGLREKGIPVLMGTETALRSIKHYMSYHFRERLHGGAHRSDPSGHHTAWVSRIAGTAPPSLPSAVGFELLRDYGIAAAAWASINGPGDIEAFADKHGYPLVLKIDAPEVPHKSEVGGVIVGLRDAGQALRAWNTLKDRHPTAPVIAQAQAKGFELLLGMNVDAQFGPVVTVGMGGIFVEILRDAISLIPPFTPEEILARLKGLACYPILAGARGQAPADLRGAAETISRFGDMCLELRSAIREIEINPLMVSSSQVAAVDCLIVPRSESA